MKIQFKKLSNFIIQLENALCCEMKIDHKKNFSKLEGYHLRKLDDYNNVDEDEETEYDI